MRPGNVTAGLLLILVGVWLALQVVAGDLPARLISWATTGADAADLPGEPCDGIFGCLDKCRKHPEKKIIFQGPGESIPTTWDCKAFLEHYDKQVA